MKGWLWMVLLAVLSGCNEPVECLVFCKRVGSWADACNSTAVSKQDCDAHYTAPGSVRTLEAECWSKTVQWVLETGGEKLDCAKPPPQYRKLESGE